MLAADGKEDQAWASQRWSSGKHLAQGQCSHCGYYGCLSAVDHCQPLGAGTCPRAQVYKEGVRGRIGAAGIMRSFEKGWEWT